MRNAYLGVAALFVTVWVVGCTTAQMRVPADVLAMQSDYIVATERKNASGAFVNESFKLGEYAVTDVDRDWDSTRHMTVWNVSKEKKTSGYAYMFKTPDGDFEGGCQIEARSKSVGFGGGMSMSRSVSKIGCGCKTGDAEVRAVLDSKDDSEYKGEVTLGDGTYRIAAIYDVEGSALGTGNPTGYRVDGDSVKAAVDVLHPGRVWLAKDLSKTDRDDLTCIFTGLMLYQGKKMKDDF